jgi:tetratricopeptide (TPR) repeat protein
VLQRGLSVDPDRRWPSMRALLAALARARTSRGGRIALAVALPVLALGWLARPQTGTACVDGDEKLAGVWDPKSRASLFEHLVTRADDESDLPRVLDDRLDAYASTWTAAWSESCAAIAAPSHDARVACLERARGELAALVEAQRRVEARGLAGALEAVANLPPIERCAELESVAVGPPPLDDPADAAVVAHVRGSIALSLALARAGDRVQALATARDALERARTLGWPPLQADALEAVASVEIAQGEYVAAEADLREAYFEAVEAGHDVGVVHVASDLIFVVGYRLARHDEGREWARHAEARLGAPGVEPLDEAALRNAIGAMLEDAGDLDGAAAAYERSRALIEAERGTEHPDVATLRNNLGNLAEKRGDFATAEAEHRIALGVRERVLGEDDEMTAMSWNNLGIALHRQGRSADAEPHFRRALEVRERVLGEDHPLVARTHMNLGVALKSLGRMADAEAHLRRAMGIFERSLGATHPDLANACLNLANVLRRTDRHDEALAVVERARGIYESMLPGDHPLVARAETFMTEIRAEREASADGSERGRVGGR